MEFSQLHFAQPVWLWSGIVIPLIWIVYFIFYQSQNSHRQLEKYIDPHLLPYLLITKGNKKGVIWKYLWVWTLAWTFLVLALAGPRWTFREIETFSKDQSLVILLDLSESMNATDVKPSRLVRARQKIEDILNQVKGVKIGLIAFAADPHMITPLTDDIETIRHLLPSLDTDLVYIQGSKLAPALEMAYNMLQSEPGNNKALLVMSDGGFEDSNAVVSAKKMGDKGIVINATGIGTSEGAPLKDQKGNIIKKNGSPILSKLQKERLQEITRAANGKYLDLDQDEIVILNELDKRAETQIGIGKINRIWEERFYFLLLPLLPIVLWWFRKGFIFASFLIVLLPTVLQGTTGDYFRNSEQQGLVAFSQDNPELASDLFQDSYRKGVSYYKAGNYGEAEKMFRKSSRPEVAVNAAYNLGNALVFQEKYKDAVTAYEDVLKQCPSHFKAKENLELVKKMLEQQKEENKQNENQKQNEQKDSDKENKEDQKQNNSEQKNKNNDNQQHKESGKDSEDQNSEEKKPNSKDPDTNPEEQDSKSDPERDSQKNEEKDQPQLAENEGKMSKASKTQEDHDADLWLNRIENDPKSFMKNKFYVESKKNGTTEGVDPW